MIEFAVATSAGLCVVVVCLFFLVFSLFSRHKSLEKLVRETISGVEEKLQTLMDFRQSSGPRLNNLEKAVKDLKAEIGKLEINRIMSQLLGLEEQIQNISERLSKEEEMTKKTHNQIEKIIPVFGEIGERIFSKTLEKIGGFLTKVDVGGLIKEIKEIFDREFKGGKATPKDEENAVEQDEEKKQQALLNAAAAEGRIII